jgi:hypothetical protein
LKVWDLESVVVIADFAADHAFTCCAVSPVDKIIVSGDSSGAVHFLRIEGMSFPPAP